MKEEEFYQVGNEDISCKKSKVRKRRKRDKEQELVLSFGKNEITELK